MLGEAGVAALVAHVDAQPPALRPALIERSASLGARMLPWLRACLGAELPVAAAALRALVALVDLTSGSQDALGVGDALALYMRADELADRGLFNDARPLQRALSQSLLAWSRRRAEAQEAWRESGVARWLTARWGRLDADRWALLPLWLCGPEESAIPRLVEVLMEPQGAARRERFVALLPWHHEDLRRAAVASPALFAWVEQIAQVMPYDLVHVNAAPNLAAAAVAAGNEEIGRAVLEALERGFDSRHAPFSQATVLNHAEFTPGLRPRFIEALVARLSTLPPNHTLADGVTLRAMGARHPDEVVAALVRVLLGPPRARQAEALLQTLLGFGSDAASAIPALRALREALDGDDAPRAAVEATLRGLTSAALH